MPSVDLGLLKSRTPSLYSKHIEDMFGDMGGEYDRFRLDGQLKRKPLFELLKEKRVTIKSKLSEKN